MISVCALHGNWHAPMFSVCHNSSNWQQATFMMCMCADTHQFHALCLPPAVRLLLLLPAACWGLSCWPTYGCQAGRSCCQQVQQLLRQQRKVHSAAAAAVYGGFIAAAAAAPTSNGCRQCSKEHPPQAFQEAFSWIVTAVAASYNHQSSSSSQAQGCTAAPAVVWRATAAPCVQPRTAGAMPGTAGCCSRWGSSSSRKGRPAGTGTR
jgi:hypothetical protein